LQAAPETRACAAPLEGTLAYPYNMFAYLKTTFNEELKMKKVMVSLVIALALFTACVQVQPAAQTPAAQTPAASTAAPVDTVSSFNLPEVTAFSVKPFNTVREYPAVLTWSVKNATDVFIEPSFGIVQPTGSKDFNTPYITTNYKLTATNAQGSIIATTTLTISGDLPGRDTPVVREFTARPYVIKKGETATLSWKTQAASAVTLDGKTVAGEGTMQVNPGETSIYNLVATSTDGTQYQTVAVNVK